MRILNGLAFALLLGALSPRSGAAAAELAPLPKHELSGRFLLQVNYEDEQGGLRDFTTSRSRVVRFVRSADVLDMLDDTAMQPASIRSPLAKIPIREETSETLSVDLNAGFTAIYLEEDRTGEDYYGRVERDDDRTFELLDRRVVGMSYHGSLLVFDQAASTAEGKHVVVHYYLSPYRPDPEFRPFEMKSLMSFGFYETYPQRRSGQWVLYATKFGISEPIVFALSSAIPARYRDAVRDGVLYWNRALGRPLIRVVDAPAGTRAPSPDFNVIEWVTSGEYASTAYIQSDPVTGQILHAHVFVIRETMIEGGLDLQRDHLRYIVAHEIGHALGLRHNFAAGPSATVMDYFDLTQILALGRDIGAGEPALPYDRDVMRHVYLGAALDVAALPAFCTDGQKGCSPFPPPPTESRGMKGDSMPDDDTE